MRPRDKTHPPDGSTNPQPPSRTWRRQVCVLRRPPLASQLLLLRPLLHLPGGSGLRAGRRPSAMPGLQPGRALSQGSRTKAPSPDRLWDTAFPQFGAPLGLQDSRAPHSSVLNLVRLSWSLHHHSDPLPKPELQNSLLPLRSGLLPRPSPFPKSGLWDPIPLQSRLVSKDFRSPMGA